MKNYYDILEVSPKASKEVIEKAYRVLAKKYHPDRYTGDKKKIAEEKLKEINVAYKVLSDDLLKDQYDSERQRENFKKTYTQEKKVNKENVSNKVYVKETENKKKKEKPKGVFDLLPGMVGTLVNAVKNIKNLNKKDVFAMGLTVCIMIVIFLLLWIIPFTHEWVYNNFIKIFQM